MCLCAAIETAGQGCCEDYGSSQLLGHAKDRIAQAGKKDSIRINRAGCLGRCGEGPVMVVYPRKLGIAL